MAPHGPPGPGYPAYSPNYARGQEHYPSPPPLGASHPYYAPPQAPYNPNVAYYQPPHAHYSQYPGHQPPLPPNRTYYGQVSSSQGERPTSPAYAQRSSPHLAPHQYRSQSPDLVQVARPYRSIIGSLSSGEMPSGGQLQNLLHSAIEGLNLLDPEAAQHMSKDDDISNDDIRFRKTRPRVEYMERPPNQLTPPLQPDSGKSLDGDDSEEEEKPKVLIIKRRKREGAGPDCSGCHSKTTPEWRRGPMGPRTLCNACGLVYGKLMNKKRTYDSAIAQGQYISPAVLFADEANEGWGDKMPTTPEESLALIKRVRKAVVGGGHPRKPKDDVSSPSSNRSSGSAPHR
ncbi:hypothetical protein CALVIDRAFT_532454 [Calocera viscosa TUFC12733]|uniref:GATA-type domain-containing protein n=1 Tax=Calocera viscosa (strain TUFC12733) TaxID=1330018 RepID=A0A167S8N8_CALVF|nr:hypothetical protein CALVIDRAFT_532454 [Calocera viscosa TUFC12733]